MGEGLPPVGARGRVMPGVWLAFRADLRVRWRAWLGVGVVIGLLGGLMLAAAAGARRTDTAYPQLVAASNQADEMVFDAEPNPQLPVISGARVEALSEVAQAGHLRAFAAVEPVNVFGSPAGNAFMVGRGVNRAHVEAGRAFAASRAREVMIDYTLADQFHLQPGSMLTLHFLRPAPGAPWLIDFAARPVAVSFRVVGVVATPGQFPPQGGGYFSGPGVYLTPAFVNDHRHDFASGDVSVVRLRPGSTAAFTAAVARLEPNGQQPDMGGLTAQDAQVQYGFHLQATALWLLAGMLAVLEVLVLTQLLIQRLTADNASWPLRWALGMTRGQLIGCGVLQAGFTGTCAGLAAVITAVGLSWLTPVGAAAAAELHPGVALDVPVVIGGAFLLGVLALLISAWPLLRLAALATAASDTSAQRRAGRPVSQAAILAGQSGLPPAAMMGVRLALNPGQGRADVDGRFSLAGAVLGVTAIVAALTFGSSLTHLTSTPRLYGVSWDAEILNGNGSAAVHGAIPVLRRFPQVSGQAWLNQGVRVRVNGMATEAQVIEPIAGSMPASITAGRAPLSGGEIALGAATMRALHARVGGYVRAGGTVSSASRFRMRVVGSAVLSPGSVTGRLGQGAMLTMAGLRHMHVALAAPPYIIVIRFRAGAVKAVAMRALQHQLDRTGSQFYVISPQRPDDLIDFGQVTYLPFALGVILAVLAIALISHVLVSTVLRRRRELAIVKALGFTRSQLRWTVVWQAIALITLAMTAGIPLGIMGGRWAWILLASQQGVVPEPVTPALPILLLLPVMIALSSLIAVLPGIAAARARPSLTLRSE